MTIINIAITYLDNGTFPHCLYTVGRKKRGTLLLSISSRIIDLFSKFLTATLCRQFYNNVIIIYLTTR